MAAEDDVRQASDRFYAALTSMCNGEAGPMDAAWSHSADVTTQHPIGGREVGWEQSGPVWGQVASMAGGGQVRLTDQLIRVGTDVAWELGTEEGEATLAGERITIKHRVTNIYRREGGEWKLVHHHSDISEPMVAVLRRLQAQAR